MRAKMLLGRASRSHAGKEGSDPAVIREHSLHLGSALRHVKAAAPGRAATDVGVEPEELASNRHPHRGAVVELGLERPNYVRRLGHAGWCAASCLDPA